MIIKHSQGHIDSVFTDKKWKKVGQEKKTEKKEDPKTEKKTEKK